MPSAADYIKRVRKILEEIEKFEWQNLPEVNEAKQYLASIRQAQRELRQLKREINAEMKAIRADYRAKSAKVQPSLLLSFLGKRRLASSLSADEKRRLRQERDSLLFPYDKVKLVIDDALTRLEKYKLAVQNFIDLQRQLIDQLSDDA